MYTDGLSEARDAEGVEFPLLERVGDALAAPLLSDALDALYAAVTAHAGAPLTDDLALVLYQPTEEPGIPECGASGRMPPPSWRLRRRSRRPMSPGPLAGPGRSRVRSHPYGPRGPCRWKMVPCRFPAPSGMGGPDTWTARRARA